MSAYDGHECLGTLGARTLLGAPGLTRNKKLLGAPGIATKNKDAISTMSAYDGHECLGGLLGTRSYEGLLASLLEARTQSRP